MDENATILVYHNNSSSPQQPSQDLKSQPKKPKNKSGRKNNQKKEAKRTPQSIAIPVTEEKLKEDHSIMLTKHSNQFKNHTAGRKERSLGKHCNIEP
jgi:hypothetical protein